MNQKPDKLIPALYGGVIMALISAIPFINFLNCLCCAGIMLGGFFAVFFYKNNFTADTPPYTSGDCMGVGALAGVFGAIIGTVLSLAFIALFGNFWGEYVLGIIRTLDIDIPAEAFEAMEQSMSAGLSFFSVMIQLLSSLVIDTLFGMLGGLIGYSVYKPKKVAMPPPPMTPQV